jgi:hypothetical protein
VISNVDNAINENLSLLAYDAILIGDSLPTFRTSSLPPYSWQFNTISTGSTVSNTKILSPLYQIPISGPNDQGGALSQQHEQSIACLEKVMGIFHLFPEGKEKTSPQR